MKTLFTILLCFVAVTVFPQDIIIPIVKISVVKINVVDVSTQARNLRESINSQIDSRKFKQQLRNKKITKVPALISIPFFECKMDFTQTYKGKVDENAFVVKTFQEEVRQGDVIIFNVNSYSNIIKSMEFVEKNKDKIGAVIIGWDSAGMNNYENLNITTYTEVMRLYSEFYSICKDIKSDLPVGVIASMTITWQEWIDACEFQYDFIALWNITKFKANFEKIKNTYFKNEEVMICGMNATDVPLNQRYDSDEYRNYIKELKKWGYCGSIYIKTEGGE